MADPAEPPFTVTRQHMALEPNENGEMHDVWHIHFRTKSGTEAHVKLPDTHYTAENAAAMIAHKATEIERVHALGTGYTPHAG